MCDGDGAGLGAGLDRTSSALGDLSGVLGYTVRVRSPSWLLECVMAAELCVGMVSVFWGDEGGRRAGEGEGEGEGVWLSVASMWFCSVGEGVGVEIGVSASCWGESNPESPEARFCIEHIPHK